MNKTTLLASSASLALFLAAAPGFAQTDFTGVSDLGDRIDDIETDTGDLFEESEDANRFGTQQFGSGFTGSVSAAGSLNTGSNGGNGNGLISGDNSDFQLGARVYNSFGDWNQQIGAAFEYGEAADVEYEKRIFAIYDINRSLSDQLYIFGLARGEYDEFSAFRRSAFAGVGPGYRVFNTPDLTWRVQAGPGVRYTEDATGDDNTDFGAIASSFFFYRLSDGIFMTNDTNVLYSETSTLISNDLGLNLRLSEVLSTRLGYVVDYETEPVLDFDNTDTSLTAAIVFSFN